MKMFKVGFDLTPLSGPSAFRGVGIYTQRLITALRKLKKIKVIEIKDKISLENLDLIHYPFFDFFFLTLPFIKKKPTVVTIHDCIPLVLSDYYPPGFRGKFKLFIQKLSLKSVSAVITDSESSKKDIIRFLGVPAEKVKTVFLASEGIFQRLENSSWAARFRKKYSLPEKYVLYVGDINYNKNLSGILKAFTKLNGDYHLVLVGKAFTNRRLPEMKILLSLIKELGIGRRVHFPGFVSESDLVRFYNLAWVYFMPSFYEGFALPVLEAMACGCPVVTSCLSSMPEIAGSASVLVDPYDENSLTEGLKKVVEDEDLRSKLITAGYSRIKEFSWEKTARQTAEIYEKIIGD